MEREDFVFLMVALVASVGTTVLSVGALSVWLRNRWRSNPDRVDAEDALGELSQQIDGIRQKYSVLSAYTTEYYATFLSAGWDDLRLLLEDLEIVENSLRLMLMKERFTDVRDVARFLLGELSPTEGAEVTSRFSGLAELSRWKSESHEILVKILQSSEVSAQKTADIGIHRKRAVKPTLVTLAELRNDLERMDDPTANTEANSTKP